MMRVDVSINDHLPQPPVNLKQILMQESGTLLPFELVNNEAPLNDIVEVCRTH